MGGQQRTITWSQAANGENFQTEQAPEHKYSTRFRVEIAFNLNGIPKISTEDQQAAALKDVLKAILARIKYTVHKGAIMP